MNVEQGLPISGDRFAEWKRDWALADLIRHELVLAFTRY
jgi:hypothetical protein